MELVPWMDQAWAELGQREVAGDGDNPRIIAFYRDAGYLQPAHDETAWCAAFVGACLQRAGIAGTGSLLARSYSTWGTTLPAPRYGAIAVFSRGDDTASGHVAFCLDASSSSIFVLGGNQGDGVTVTAIDRGRLLGLRWPAITAAPASVPGNPAATPPEPVFEVALAHVLQMEGGWTDDRYDPGGPTNLGITLATLAAHRGVTLDATTFASLREQLRQISQTEVRDIYRRRYWEPCRAGELHPALAVMHFDATVNHGPGASSRMLQEAVGAKVDGEIGPETLAACASAELAEALPAYAELRRARYRALNHFWRFGKGWLARVDATLVLATRLCNQAQGGTMTDASKTEAGKTATPADSTDQTSKWWGQSMTMWGVIITAASTVVPVLGPLVGITISADTVQQIGAQTIQVAQGIGGLVGTIMTVYGRTRANSRLGVRSFTVQI